MKTGTAISASVMRTSSSVSAQAASLSKRSPERSTSSQFFARAQLGEGAQQLALLAAAQRRLLLPEGVEGRIQVQVRRVEHTYHRNLTALTAVQRPVFSSRVKSAPSSLTGPPAHS